MQSDLVHSFISGSNMTRNNKIQIILFVLFIAFMAMPAIQQNTKLFKVIELNGDVEKSACPKLTFNSFIKNEYQAKAEKYLSENFGFREYAIRLYNQYAWSCFGMYFNSTIRVGKDNWIYNSDLVRDHYESLMYYFCDSEDEMKLKFDAEALRLWKLQNVLNEYGVKLFVCMTPAKDIIFPEYLPDEGADFRKEGLHAYDYYVDKFKQLEINNVDLCSLFLQMKGNVDYMLYPKSGSHWSNLAVAHIGDTLVRYMEKLGNKNIPNLAVGEPYVDAPHKPDNDLEKVMNLQFSIGGNVYYYADVTALPDTTAQKTRMLVMGDSYCQGINYTLPLDDIFAKYRYWYYNNFVYYDPVHNSVNEVDIIEELLDLDYLMIIWCPINMYNLGRSFVGKALINLCIDDKRFQQVFNSVADSLKNDGSGVSQSDVYDEIYGNPERFFKELAGNSIPECRNPRNAVVVGDSSLLTLDEMAEKKIRHKLFSDMWLLRSILYDAESRLISNEEAVDEEVGRELQNDMSGIDRQKQIKSIELRIYEDRDWLEAVKKKARKKGIPLQEAVVSDAEWMYDNQYSK